MAKFLANELDGTINKASGDYYVLSVYKQSALHAICKLINGKFRTPKIEALHRLINWLNDKQKGLLPFFLYLLLNKYNKIK